MDKLSVYRKAFESVVEYLDNEDADVGHLRGMIKGYLDIIGLFDTDVTVEAITPAEPEKIAEAVAAANTRQRKRTINKVSKSDLYRMHTLADQGYTQAKIAQIIGLNQSTVSIHLKGYSKRKTTEPPASVVSWIK